VKSTALVIEPAEETLTVSIPVDVIPLTVYVVTVLIAGVPELNVFVVAKFRFKASDVPVDVAKVAVTTASVLAVVAPFKFKRSKFLKIAELPIVTRVTSSVSVPAPASIPAPVVTEPPSLTSLSLPAPKSTVVVTKPPNVAFVEPIAPVKVTVSSPEPVLITWPLSAGVAAIVNATLPVLADASTVTSFA